MTEGKVAFLEEAAKLIATISSPIERDVYSSKVASELGVDKNAFKQQDVYKRQPYILVIGDNEMNSSTVTVRSRKRGEIPNPTLICVCCCL